MSLNCKPECVINSAGECSLADAGCSRLVQISSHSDCGAATRLRELGFSEGRVVHIVAGVDPLICAVGRARVALARRLADSIVVRPLHV